MSVEGEDEARLDGFGGLAVGRQEVVDLGARHVDPVLRVHVLRIVLVKVVLLGQIDDSMLSLG